MFSFFTFHFQFLPRILKPVKEMETAAKQFASGNWNARLNPRRNDELGRLSQTMNSMAEKIEQHFRSVRELLIAVSHEIRSPLARMKVALESVDDKATKNTLNEEITLLDNLTANLLEKERLDSHPEALKVKPTELQEFLAKIVSPFGPRLVLDMPESSITVELDPNRMALCLRNVISNSIKYTVGSVRVSLEGSRAGATISISDDGPGIAPDDLPHVTEPFFRGDASRTGDGFGLGLSLCQSIVKAHGGEFNIESARDRGTIVQIVLKKAQ